MALYPDLKDRLVLVTGGANGIGAATVRALCQQAARVFFCDLELKAGKALEKELASAVFSKVDLVKQNEVVHWVESIGKEFGRIDVLVNNAARDPRIPFDKMTVEAWDELFACNLRSCFLTSQAAVRWMKPSGGSIINLASITFHNAPAEMSAYVGTKGGVIGFTRSLARELGPRHIRVNAVSPGWTMTERQLRQYVTPAGKKRIRASQCIPDLIQPEEIAEVILFLASDVSRAITGQEILADRGWEHS